MSDSSASSSRAAEQAGVRVHGASLLNNLHSGASAGGGSVGSSWGSQPCWAGGLHIPRPWRRHVCHLQKVVCCQWNANIMLSITPGMPVKGVDCLWKSFWTELNSGHLFVMKNSLVMSGCTLPAGMGRMNEYLLGLRRGCRPKACRRLYQLSRFRAPDC